MSNQQKHHLQELNTLHETLQSQKDAWQQQYTKTQQEAYSLQQKAWKEKLVAERDAEIEMIISRLTSEGSADTSDLERRHRMEIERLKTESANNIRDLRQEHSLALDRVVDYQNRVADLEKEHRQLRKDASSLENAKMAKEQVIVQQRSALERLQVNEQELSSVIRMILLLDSFRRRIPAGIRS